MRGSDQARWVSLLDARDRYGRLRGSAGALLLNYAGNHAGSSWAFFGVESRDIFEEGSATPLEGLGRLARFLVSGVYLRNLSSDLAAYEPGETATLAVTIENRGRTAAEGRVEFLVYWPTSVRSPVEAHWPAKESAASPANPAAQSDGQGSVRTQPGGSAGDREDGAQAWAGPGVALQPQQSVRVEPGQSLRVEVKASVPQTASGLVRFAARLFLGGKAGPFHSGIESWRADSSHDQAESGFVALSGTAISVAPGAAPSESAPSAVPRLAFRDNYFRYGDRALFLFGSDNYGNVYQAACEGPLWWAREHDASRDFGFQIYENLQYSNRGYRMTEVDWRRFRGMAQLTQERGLTFMPGLLIGENVAVSDAVVAEQSRQCGEYAARLRGTARLLWYLNGDYQLRHDDLPALRSKWQAFLLERYGSAQLLKASWGADHLPAGGAAPFAIEDLPFPPPNSGRWESVPWMDLYRFHLRLMADWNRAHVAAIRREDREHPITSEYYQFPFWGMDLRLTIDGQDVSNVGYFDEPDRDIDLLPLRIRWNDLRAEGKSVGLGEYGVKTHPAWVRANGATGYHIARTEEEEKRLFIAVAHYAFGMGCSRVQNWCLRDADERVFPWGVFYPGPLVPKDVAFVHRNLSLAFRTLEPRHEAARLTVLLPDGLRLGNREDLGVEVGLHAFEALLGLHADFTVLGDSAAERIPVTTAAVIYPAALCVADAPLEALERWVRAGGKLLMTGAPILDEDRRPVPADRLARLAGVEASGVRYAATERSAQPVSRLRATDGAVVPELAAAPLVRLRPADAAVLAIDAGGDPVLVQRKLGQGSVTLFADPLELRKADEDGALRRLYAWFLGSSGIERLAVAPDDPELHVFAQRTRTGRAHVAFNRRKDGRSIDARLGTSAGEVSLRARGGYPAMAAVSDEGVVSLLGAFGFAAIGGRELLAADCQVTAVALDGADLRQSEAVLILPFGEGKVRLFSERAWKSPVSLLGDFDGGWFRVLERRAARAASAHSGGAHAAAALAARAHTGRAGMAPPVAGLADDAPAGAAPAGAGLVDTSPAEAAAPVADRGEVSIDFDVDRATLVAIVCEEGEASRWEALLSRLVTVPESMPGR